MVAEEGGNVAMRGWQGMLLCSGRRAISPRTGGSRHPFLSEVSLACVLLLGSTASDHGAVPDGHKVAKALDRGATERRTGPRDGQGQSRQLYGTTVPIGTEK